MTPHDALELLRRYFEEAAALGAVAPLRFVGRAGEGFVVVLAAPAAPEAGWEFSEADPATVAELSEERVREAERVLAALRRDHPALVGARVSLAFDDPEAPELYPGPYRKR